ncbi:MAG TPA: response regulator [Candidatus Polarisedimenticolia bacterium]
MKPYVRLDDRHLLGIADHTEELRYLDPEHHRILAVDDDELILDLLSQTLASQRYHVDVARTCEDALPKILFNDYSGILLDLVLPDSNGLGLFRQIARRRPAMRSRVAFLTGALDTGEAVRFVRLVNVPVLRKPFDLGDLISTVRQLTLAEP